jgi:hypothetical protein
MKFVSSKAYNNTNWIYGEVPVESSKLNDWDSNIEDSLAFLHKAISLLYSGNGVFNESTGNELEVKASDIPDMSIKIGKGMFLHDGEIGRLDEDIIIDELQAPVSNPRIDIVQIGLLNWAANVKEGEEAASPEAPEVDGYFYKLAEIYHRTGETCIKDSDDGSNGYIVDCRSMLSKIS